MKLTLITQIVWYAVIVAEWYLFIRLLMGRAWKQFPWFVIWIGFSALRSLVLLYVSHHHTYQVYFWTYWCGCAIQTLVMAGVLFEIFSFLFRPVSIIPSRTLRDMGAVMLLVTTFAVSIAMYRPVDHAQAYIDVILTVNRSLMIVACAAIWGLSFFSDWLGIPWLRWQYGLGLGLMFYLTVTTVASAMAAWFPHPLDRAPNLVQMIAFLVSLCVWSWYFSRPDTKRLTPTPEQLEQIMEIMRQMTARLEQLNISLGKGRK